MGPYCKYCMTRCFVPLTEEWPEHILEAYKPYSIAATCPDGQAAEKRALGWCYNDARAVMDNQFAIARLALQKILRANNAIEDALREVGGYDNAELNAAATIIRGATAVLLGAIEELVGELPIRAEQLTVEVNRDGLGKARSGS